LPLIWAAINTALFLLLNERNYGGEFRAWRFAFVDDIDHLQTQHHKDETIKEIVDELQGSLDVWQGNLRSSGESLDCDDPNKSYWYSIDYNEWNSNGCWKYCAYDDDLEFMMYDEKGRRRSVPHCHIDDAHMTLCVMLSPDDNNSLHIYRMWALTLQFSVKAIVDFIRGHNVIQTLNGTIMRPLLRPPPSMTLTEAECTHIMEPIIKSVLAKLQIVGTIKHDVIYGSMHIQCIGFKNLYTILGIVHYSLLVQFYNSDTDLGELLQTSLECITMELTMPEIVFHYDFEKYSAVTP